MTATAAPATSPFERAASTMHAARDLAEQRHDAADRQHETDLDLRPFLRGQIDRDERAEAGLHVGEKKMNQSRPRRLCFDGGRRRSARSSTSNALLARDRRPRSRSVTARASSAIGPLVGTAPAPRIVIEDFRRSAQHHDRRVVPGIPVQRGTWSPRQIEGDTGLSATCQNAARLQSTDDLALPTPRKPPKSITAARILPARSTITSTMRPMSSIGRAAHRRGRGCPLRQRRSRDQDGLAARCCRRAAWLVPIPGRRAALGSCGRLRPRCDSAARPRQHAVQAATAA